MEQNFVASDVETLRIFLENDYVASDANIVILEFCTLNAENMQFGKYSQFLVIYDNVLNRRFSKMLKMSTILPIETVEIWPYFAHFWQQFGAKIFKYAENVH